MMRKVSTGPLTFYYSQDGLRRLTWNGTELVRALAWPIRDENWGTYPARIIAEAIDDSDGFTAHLTFEVGDGRLICDLRVRALDTGDVFADLVMTPKGGPFSTNRAGFTVLHPIKGIAGAPLHVSHADGISQETTFPKHIQPNQPVKDIAGLQYGLDGQSVKIDFEGEVFEMEDQRNWSDASFKTYCVPLVYPFTYDITEPTRQSIRMRFSGDAVPVKPESERSALRVEASRSKALDIGLAVETGWLPKSSAALDASYILLRTSPGAPDFPDLAAFARDFPATDLEIVLPDDMLVEDGLRDVAGAITAAGLSPTRVIALRDSYLGSYQPAGPWPEGPAPNDMLEAVRSAFPQAAVGGGMLTNFTEVNRCRPDTAGCDYITHGLTPLVHAGDDMSVLETLETLPQIFASTAALAKGLPYRLGLASIGMRSNPYGAAVAENPTQVRRTMARIDPRHRALFGAAYAVGVLAATEGSKVEALCLGAPAGPFGLVYNQSDYPQAGYDGTDRTVFPLYHVVRAACSMTGHPRVSLNGLPEGIAGYGAELDGTFCFMLANVTDRARRVALGNAAETLCLDVETFDAATTSAEWLDTATHSKSTDAELRPFSVAFLRTEQSSR
ncbi:hypothetical protein [Antarctobacter sp.]|uniref:hypothetical protein n=1 Tax=Antarctobacter sp. TaxID=1872577 RepID=UPI002B266BA5|nr:hypothetical protein [Antarctobacter sp.]